jgi:hypothetical protein
MNVQRFVLASLVVGVVMNVIDYVFHGLIMASTYASLPLFRQDSQIAWLVFGDFVFAFVFVWVFARVRGSFAAGAGGGATFGFYAGVLLSFPMNLFLHLLLVGFPYSLSWIWTVYGIVAAVIAGAVAGALYKK